LRCATASSSIAGHGIRSAPAWSTHRGPSDGPTRSTPWRSTRGSPPPTRCRTRLSRSRPPEAAFAMERIIDLVAGELGLEPSDVRLRNMIGADEMPYRAGIPYRDGEPIVYDGGDYQGALQKCWPRSAASRRSASASARPGRRPLSRSRHRLLCRGTGRRPVRERDGTHRPVRQDPGVGRAPARKGRAWRRSSPRWWPTPGRSSRRRGDDARRHICHCDRVRHHCESQHRHLIRAIHGASERLRVKVLAIAANLLECATGDLELRNGGVGIVGVPGAEVSLAKVAQASRPAGITPPPGIDAGLEETFYYERPRSPGSYAVHAAILEVDNRAGTRDHRQICHRA